MKSIFSSFRSSTYKSSEVKSDTLAAHSFNREIKEETSLTVVELFQSQGCSSCPPANSNVIRVSEDPSLLVLTYEVTYWDRLGWKDTFGDHSFDQRQWEYARGLNHKNVFTPQVIINGRVDGVGNDPKELKSLIAKGTQGQSSGLSVTPLDGFVTLTGDDNQQGIVLIIRYDPRVHDVAIPRGENSGKNLPHKNIVRDVTVLGSYHGGSQRFPLSKVLNDDLKMAILVQDGPGGVIIGAARV